MGVNIQVVFYSMYGHVEKLADAVAEGARSVKGTEVVIKRVPELMSAEAAAKAGLTIEQPCGGEGQCGKCRVNCVLEPTAVKCVHAFALCGYCNLCTGYYHPEILAKDTAAENQLCPTGAIRRRFVEDPHFEYTIDEGLCVGCGKCVKGCTAFGNGSLFLQVRHDRCVNCNQCSIASACPAQAFVRVPASKPYLIKGQEKKA